MRVRLVLGGSPNLSPWIYDALDIIFFGWDLLEIAVMFGRIRGYGCCFLLITVSLKRKIRLDGGERKNILSGDY